MPKKELQKKVKLSEELLAYANSKGMSEEILKRLVLVTGAFIKIVRDTGKCPGVQALFKKETEIGIAADEARRLRAIFGEAVAYIKGTSAKLYRDNKTAKELMPQIIDLYFTMEAPAATRHYKTKEVVIAEAPVVEDPVVPDWQNVPVPEGPLEDVSFPDITTLTDGQLNMLKLHIAAEEERREEQRKQIAEIQELCELKGLTFDQLYEKFQLVKSLMK